MQEIYRLFVPSIIDGMLHGFCLLIQALATGAVSLICHPETIAALLIISAYVFISSKLNKHNF